MFSIDVNKITLTFFNLYLKMKKSMKKLKNYNSLKQK